MYGIICCEHVGKEKKWQIEDVQFLLSLSENYSLCLQVKDRIETELKLMRSNAELKKSNEFLEQFAKVASHDLKSPLRVIMSYLSLVQSKHANDLPSEVNTYLQHTAQSASRLDSIINGMLQYSKLEMDDVEKSWFSVSELIEKIKQDDSHFIEENNATVTILGDLPFLVTMESMIYQVFFNIIHNAIKYKQENTNPIIEISFSNDDLMMHFEFRDNGIGIENVYNESIFDMYTRIHKPEEIEGTGIGLATCKKICEKLGGKITCRTREDQVGSLFTVSLPMMIRG
jgi:light-regulated signal transduction histidine kinase (bacteriophytochrome)